jgi:hypothetical protein
MENESNSKKLADIDDGKLQTVRRQLLRKLPKFAVRRAILGPLAISWLTQPHGAPVRDRPAQ